MDYNKAMTEVNMEITLNLSVLNFGKNTFLEKRRIIGLLDWKKERKCTTWNGIEIGDILSD